MKVVKTVCRFAVLAAALAVFPPTPPARAQEFTMRLHHFLPLQAVVPAKAIQPWIDKVEKESGGRIEIQHFPTMQLGGKPPGLYDQARDGVVDIVWTLMGYTPGRFPKTEVFELPFIATTAEATSRAFYDYAHKNALGEFSEVRPLVFHTHGPGLLHLRGDGIEKLEDMRGRKIRAPTRIIAKMLDHLGATAVGMPVPAVPEALSKGVIDGAVIPWEVALPLKIHDLADSHTSFSGENALYVATFMLAMNKDSYERLPADLRAVIDANSGIETSALFGRAMAAGDKAGLAKAKTTDNKIVVLDEAETARWREAARPVVSEWLAEMKEKDIDGEALLKDARALIDRYSR